MNNKSVEYCCLRIDPFVREDDINEVNMFGEYDLIIKFKDGRKYTYDMFTNTFRRILYEDDNLTDDQWNFEFRTRLSQLISRNFITNKELAERMDTSEVTISRYLNGRCIPNSRMLDRLITALGCSFEEFFYFKYF